MGSLAVHQSLRAVPSSTALPPAAHFLCGQSLRVSSAHVRRGSPGSTRDSLQCSASLDQSPPKDVAAKVGPGLMTRMKQGIAASMVCIHVLAPIPLDDINLVFPSRQDASAVLLSPDTKVPKNAEVALRRAVPVVNQDLRKIQDGLEEIFVFLRIPQRKPYGSMESAVKKALAIAEAEQTALIAAVPDESKATASKLLEAIRTSDKEGLPGLLKAVQAKDADIVSIRLANTLDNLAQLAVLQAPGLPFFIPAQFDKYPRLTGRAVVEFTVLKSDGSTFSIKNGAESTTTGQLTAVLDGYSAPLTAGNFARLVSKREYDGVAVKTTSQAVLSDARNAAKLASETPEMPLELKPSGEFQPVYRTALDVADGELPVLPMSVFGAVVMAHSPQSDGLNSPSQFFFFLYDKRNSGLGGLAFDEGQFSVFGYVTEGKDILSQLRTGDVIQSARLVSGSDRLVVPGSESSAAEEEAEAVVVSES